MKTKVSVVKCANYEPALVQAAVKRAVELAGGITAFVKPGSKVLLKPNLFQPKEPQLSITTHPEVVRAVARILKEIGCKIFLGDGPVVFGRMEEDIMDELYAVTGISAVAKEEGVTLVRFDKRRWRGKFPMTTWVDDCDYLINLPKLKTHELMLMTGAVKNLFGTIPGIYKVELHRKYPRPRELAEIMVEVYLQARPALTIVDGITAMEGDGPGLGGKPRNSGLLFAGSDCVAIDTVMARVIGIEPLEVLTTKAAAKRSAGTSDINLIEIAGERLQDAAGKPFLLPVATLRKKLSPLLLRLVERFLKHYPVVIREKCIKCGACAAGCPAKAIHLKKMKVVFKYSRCISCFCCQEGCPASAIKTKRGLLARIMGV